jgi:hypothetical protein
MRGPKCHVLLLCERVGGSRYVVDADCEATVGGRLAT